MWKRLVVAFSVTLSLTGCFLSDEALVQPSDYARPAITGRWLNLSLASASDVKRLSAAERKTNCRIIDDRLFCGKYGSIVALPNGTFRRQLGAESQLFALASMGTKSFVVQRFGDDGNGAAYAYAEILAPDMIQVRTLACGRDRFLYDLVDFDGGGHCKIANVTKLYQLMARFGQSPSRPEATEWLLRN